MNEALFLINRRRSSGALGSGDVLDPPPSQNLQNVGRRGDYNDALIQVWKNRWNAVDTGLNLGGAITYASLKAEIEATANGVTDSEFILDNAFLMTADSAGPENNNGLKQGQVAYLPYDPSTFSYDRNRGFDKFSNLYSDRTNMIDSAFRALMTDDWDRMRTILDLLDTQQGIEISKYLDGFNSSQNILYYGQNGEYENGNTIFEMGKCQHCADRVASYIADVIEHPDQNSSQIANNVDKWNRYMAYSRNNNLWLNTQAYKHLLGVVNNVQESDILNGTSIGLNPQNWDLSTNPFNFSAPGPWNNNNSAMPNYAFQDASGNRLRRIYQAQATINNATISVIFGSGLYYYMSGASERYFSDVVDILFKCLVLYGIYPDGRIFNHYRAAKDDTQAYLGPRDVYTGLYYFTIGQMEMAVKMIADLVNSAGQNTTLWDYTTSLGNSTFQTTGGSKNLRLALESMLLNIDGTRVDYVQDAPLGADIPSGASRSDYIIGLVETLNLQGSNPGRIQTLANISNAYCFHADYYNSSLIRHLVERTGPVGTQSPWSNIINGTWHPVGAASTDWKRGAAGFDVSWFFKWYNTRQTSAWSTISQF